MIRNTNDFKIAVENKWPNLYDCSNTLYVKAHIPVNIICKKHGLFSVDPYNGLRKKYICPKCNDENTIYKHKLTKDDWINRFKHLHGDRYDYSLINDDNISDNTVPIICKNHGIFYQNKYNHGIKGQGCKKCNATSHHGSNKKLLEKPLTLKEQNNNYKPHCIKITKEIFIQRSIEKYGDVTDFSKAKFIDRCTPVELICKKHNKHFFVTPKHHFNYYGCPECAKERRSEGRTIPYKEWLNICKFKHGNKYDYSLVKYTNGYSIIDLICTIHGKFSIMANRHAFGGGCPKCNESRIESEIRLLCEHNNIEYIYQKTFPWMKNYRLDFFIPTKNIAIECQGEQHFKQIEFFDKTYEDFLKRKFRDKDKFNLCKDHNIKIIYYSKSKHKGCTTKIENILKQIK